MKQNLKDFLMYVGIDGAGLYLVYSICAENWNPQAWPPFGIIFFILQTVAFATISTVSHE